MVNWRSENVCLEVFDVTSNYNLKFIDTETKYGEAIIISEIKNNPGRSVTNGCEDIAEQLYDKFAIKSNMSDVIWIEHYQYPNNTETYDLIQFDVIELDLTYGNPQWKRLYEGKILTDKNEIFDKVIKEALMLKHLES